MKHKSNVVPQSELDKHNWLNNGDVGKMVHVVGHWSGDFIGTVEYGGQNLAIVRDIDGVCREICYLHPVEFHKL